MYECSSCKCLFDAGELHGGVCDDCIEKEEQHEARKEWTRKMLARNVMEQPNGQLVMFHGAG